jgi:hypothetical protein
MSNLTEYILNPENRTIVVIIATLVLMILVSFILIFVKYSNNRRIAKEKAEKEAEAEAEAKAEAELIDSRLEDANEEAREAKIRARIRAAIKSDRLQRRAIDMEYQQEMKDFESEDDDDEDDYDIDEDDYDVDEDDYDIDEDDYDVDEDDYDVDEDKSLVSFLKDAKGEPVEEIYARVKIIGKKYDIRQVILLRDGSPVTRDYRKDRIRIFYDEDDLVTNAINA